MKINFLDSDFWKCMPCKTSCIFYSHRINFTYQVRHGQNIIYCLESTLILCFRILKWCQKVIALWLETEGSVSVEVKGQGSAWLEPCIWMLMCICWMILSVLWMQLSVVISSKSRKRIFLVIYLYIWLVTSLSSIPEYVIFMVYIVYAYMYRVAFICTFLGRNIQLHELYITMYKKSIFTCNNEMSVN